MVKTLFMEKSMKPRLILKSPKQRGKGFLTLMNPFLA
jgi:hypothetical protein